MRETAWGWGPVRKRTAPCRFRVSMIGLAMTTRPQGPLLAEIERKEGGPFHHFLDGVWRLLPLTAGCAVGVSLLAALFLGGQLLLSIFTTSMLTLQVAAGARGVQKWRQGERCKRLYDSPRYQEYLRTVEARARGLVASQRGTVWVVADPSQAAGLARVMTDSEYERFKAAEIAAGRSLDEVRVRIRRGASTIQHAAAIKGHQVAVREIDMSRSYSPNGQIERWLTQAPASSKGR